MLLAIVELLAKARIPIVISNNPWVMGISIGVVVLVIGVRVYMASKGNNDR